MKVDLYLDGQQGHWLLASIDPDTVGRVITNGAEIGKLALSRGVKTTFGRPDPCSDGATTALSMHYKHILTGQEIARHSNIYNIHPSYLPWGRGYYPIFWALWERTPAGATLHRISEGIDTGPIVERRSVEYTALDTGSTLQASVYAEERHLFQKWWPHLLAGEILPTFAQEDGGTYHSMQQFFDIKTGTDLDTLSSEKLIRLIFALTHSDHSGLILRRCDKEFSLSLVKTEDIANESK
jgi:methionyl-tRNA formyltransferase